MKMVGLRCKFYQKETHMQRERERERERERKKERNIYIFGVTDFHKDIKLLVYLLNNTHEYTHTHLYY